MDGDSSCRSSTAEDNGDPAVWESFNESLSEVQSVLDRNRLLIEQVNENQHSRLRNNMLKNVSLIQELYGNISKVVALYSDLNSNFSAALEQQQHSKKSAANAARDES